MKKTLLILCIAIFALGLTACGETKEPAAEPNGQPVQENTQEDTQTVEGVPLEQYLAENYPLESKKIEIFVNQSMELIHVATITDPADIQTLISSVDFSSWEKVLPQQGYDGICYYYVHFNDNCTVSLYEDDSYGGIEKGTVDSIHDLSAEGHFHMGDFYMAEDLLPTVKAMVEKYGTPST